MYDSEVMIGGGQKSRNCHGGWWWSAWTAGVFVVAGAIGLTIIRYLGQPEGGPEGIVAALALAAPFYGAGLIGLLGVVGNRPGYCFAAALALLPISIISIATIPLQLAALALFAFAIRTEPRALRIISDVPLAGPLVVALFLLLMHRDPAEWDTPNGSGSASDVITTFEAVCSFALVGAAVTVAWMGVRRSLRRSSRG
jgi:hypothetical protein